MTNKIKDGIWIGVDLGGTKMMAVAFDHKFNKLHSVRKNTHGKGSLEGLPRIARLLDDLLKEAELSKSQIVGIGFGCPGPLDLDRGIILETPNIGWQHVSIKEAFEKSHGCPVVIANDVDAGTYGEYRFGAGRKARCVLGVFPGTGIGGACVYNGKIIRGKTGSCMEIGHFPVDPLGPVVGPGRKGTLEAVASRLAISAQAATAVYRGQAPALKKLVGTDLAKIKSGSLAKAIQEGDKVVEDIVRLAASRLGVTIAGVVNLLAPDVLVLGGGLVEAMPKIYVEEVGKRLKELSMKTFLDHLKIAAAQLGDDAVAMGAAALAEEAHTR